MAPWPRQDGECSHHCCCDLPCLHVQLLQLVSPASQSADRVRLCARTSLSLET